MKFADDEEELTCLICEKVQQNDGSQYVCLDDDEVVCEACYNSGVFTCTCGGTLVPVDERNEQDEDDEEEEE